MLRFVALLIVALLSHVTLAERPYTGIVTTTFKSPEDGKMQWVSNLGTFAIIGENEVLTNYHVVADYLHAQEMEQSISLRLRFADGSSRAATVVKGNHAVDLALLTFRGKLPSGVHTIGLADEFNPEVLTMGGYPHGEVKEYAEDTTSKYFPVGDNFFRFPVVAIQGQSGSPIVDQNGKLCGLLWGSDWPEREMAYGVKVTSIHEFLK
jgi:S1-C subfamily serine protease